MGAYNASVYAQAPTAVKTAQSPGGLERLLAARPVIDKNVSLDEAVQIAMRESPVVRGAQDELEAAAGRLNSARGETRPWVSANTFASGGSNGNIVSTSPLTQPQMIMGLLPGGFVDGNLMLMYPLYTGGRLSAMIRQAVAMRSASQADLGAQRQEVALMTRMAFREARARQSLVGVAQARLKENQERLRVDREKLEQGAAPLVTVRRDESEAAMAEQEVTNAERDVELSLVQLKTVMGISPASRLELSGANEYQPSADLLKRLTGEAQSSTTIGQAVALPPDLAALLREAERQRPELQAATQRVEGARADTSVAKGAFQPQVNLFAMGDVMKSRGSDSFAGTTFGLAASLPLYNGGQRRARVQTADAERRKQEEERNRIALQVAQEVSTALLNLRAAEKNIETARKGQTAAEEGYRVALLRFQAGRSIQLELLDALAARTKADSGVVQALFQYNVAQDQLLRATGALVPVR